MRRFRCASDASAIWLVSAACFCVTLQGRDTGPNQDQTAALYDIKWEAHLYMCGVCGLGGKAVQMVYHPLHG